MFAKQMFDLRTNLDQTGVMFAYCGFMTEQVRTAVGEALKLKLTLEDVGTKTMRSVFAVFVEQMQNIIRYSAERTEGHPLPKSRGASVAGSGDNGQLNDLRYGILTIGQENGQFVVNSGNLIYKADVERLRERLTEIRNMNRDELKARYRQILKSEPDADSKGAGVGFIEMARRASRPIEFDFTDIDDERAFFIVRTFI
jgi:hypothetical protein